MVPKLLHYVCLQVYFCINILYIVLNVLYVKETYNKDKGGKKSLFLIKYCAFLAAGEHQENL